MTTEVAPSGGRRELVVPVDDSEDTVKACKWMLDNVYRPGDMVNLIRVVPWSAQDMGDVPVWYGVYEAPIIPPTTNQNNPVEEGLHLINDKFVPMMAAQQVLHRVHVLTHSTDTSGIAKTIADKAQELGAHCIVLAHHKKSTLQTWFLGSVCLDLVNLAIPTPLIIIRG